MSDYNPDADPRSSNTLIHEYLASRGMQPNNPNYAQAVRTALAANFANPGMIRNAASTLINEGPPAADVAAPGGGGGGGGRSAPARPITPEGTNVTVPNGQGNGNPNTPAPGPPANASGGNPTTSASPGGGGGGGPVTPTTPPSTGGETSLWDQILNNVPLNAGPAAASWMLRRFGPGGGGSVNQPGLPDIRLGMNRPEITGQPAQLGGSDATLRLSGPTGQPQIPGVEAPQRMLPAPEQRLLLAAPEQTIPPMQAQPRTPVAAEPVAVPPPQSATSAAIDKAVPPTEPPAPRARAPRKPRVPKLPRVSL